MILMTAAAETLTGETPLSEGAGAGLSLLSPPSATVEAALGARAARDGAGGDGASGELVSGLMPLLSSTKSSSDGAGAAFGGADLVLPVEEGDGAAVAEGVVGGGVVDVAGLGGDEDGVAAGLGGDKAGGAAPE